MKEFDGYYYGKLCKVIVKFYADDVVLVSNSQYQMENLLEYNYEKIENIIALSFNP